VAPCFEFAKLKYILRYMCPEYSLYKEGKKKKEGRPLEFILFFKKKKSHAPSANELGFVPVFKIRSI
jgi:hypothetical protein